MNILLALAVQFHLDIEIAFVLNKIDLVSKETIKLFDTFFMDPEEFLRHLSKRDQGTFAELAGELIGIIHEFLPPTRLVTVSAVKRENIEDLYSIIHAALCECGDLT